MHRVWSRLAGISGPSFAKQFVPTFPLRIASITDLRPRCALGAATEGTLHEIPAVLLFGDYAFEIMPTALLEQCSSGFFHVVDVDDRARLRWKESFQQALAFDERVVENVPAVEPQQIKCAEILRL